MKDILTELRELYDKCDKSIQANFADYVLYCMGGIDMSFLSDKDITAEIIKPYINYKNRECPMSYGLEPYGYTLRVSNKILIDDEILEEPTIYILKGHEGAVISTLESIKVPAQTIGLLEGKSSYLRQNLMYSFGGIEPGYEGTLTFSIYNGRKKDIPIYINQGICQIKFFKCNEISTTLYEGKYQGSKGTVPYIGGV